MRSGLDIDLECARELIEADVTDGNVPKRDGDVHGLTRALKLPISAIVQLQRLVEAVLTVVDVSKIQV